jgi:hypothetical protein
MILMVARWRMARAAPGETWSGVRRAGPGGYRGADRVRGDLSHIGSGPITLRARAALTAFKTLKTDRGTGL